MYRKSGADCTRVRRKSQRRWRHPDRSRSSGEGKDLRHYAPRAIPRPAERTTPSTKPAKQFWRICSGCVNYLRNEILPQICRRNPVRFLGLPDVGRRPAGFELRLRLRRASQAGCRDRHRPVSRRLSGTLPRPIRRRRLPLASRPRRLFPQLQLQLRQYAHGSRTRHVVYRRLQQWPRHCRQRVVGPKEEATGDFRGRQRHQTGRRRRRQNRRFAAQSVGRHSRG